MQNKIRQLSFLVVLLLAAQFLAYQARAQTAGCVESADMVEIAQHFPQFQSYITDGKSSYCEADVGAQWIKVLNSIVTLKKLQPQDLDYNEADALTYKAIDEPNWWEYFIARARSFQIPAQCRPGVGAYVFPLFADGTIYLCPPFFESSTASQASILMHEVRHYDGYSHVMCTRGMDKGNSGACDDDILQKGSYAISVQTLVGMSRIQGMDLASKSLLESEAIYTAFNRFNVLPKVKVNEAIVLSNNQGEVYRWNIGVGRTYEKIGELESPARVYNSYNNLTIYPLDPSQPAYRMDKELVAKMPSIGLFANFYNAESQEQKALYKNITYLGDGGLIKDNQLVTFCSNQDVSIQGLDSYGEMERIISISSDEVDSDYTSVLVSQTGELFQFKCAQRGTPQLEITPYSLRLSPELVGLKDAFSLGGKTYAVSESGELKRLKVENDMLVATQTVFPFSNNNWVSATPLSRPEIFSE